MPNAEIKLFITADIDIRAQRRFNEIKNKDNVLTYKKVFDNLNKRDFDDVNREINPLIKAQDSIEIDNSNLSEVEQNNMIFELISNKIKV
jgi:cytidylate kinase